MSLYPEFITRKTLLDGMQVFPGMMGQQPPAQPAQPPMQPRSPGRLASIAHALSSVYGGPDDPRLTDEQNRQARSQAMINAGLSTLASDKSGLAAVAEGALYGRQAGAQDRATSYGENRMAQVQKMIQANGGNVDLPELRRLFVDAVAHGDKDASQIGDVLKVIENRQSSATDPGAYMVQKSGINPATGKPEMYNMDRRSGKIFWLGVAPIPTGGQSSGAAEQQAFARENQLVDDYRAEMFKHSPGYEAANGALGQADKAIAGDPAARASLLISFVKSSQQGNAIRPGEIAVFQRAAPFMQRMQTIADDYLKGKSPLISDQMTKQMVDILRDFAAEKAKSMNDVYDTYKTRAKRWGVSADAFTPPPTTTTKPVDSGKPPWER